MKQACAAMVWLSGQRGRSKATEGVNQQVWQYHPPTLLFKQARYTKRRGDEAYNKVRRELWPRVRESQRQRLGDWRVRWLV